MSTIRVTNLATGRAWDLPYVPYAELNEGDLYVRWSDMRAVPISGLRGRFDEKRGTFRFADDYPEALTRRAFPVYRRRDIGGDLRL
jgi:hypothetical protein